MSDTQQYIIPGFKGLLAGLLVLISLSALPVQAERFKTNALEFNLTPRWQCQLDQTEWVCLPRTPNERGEAIIVISAKQAGPQESLASLKSHLSTPRTIPNAKGLPVQSKVLKAKDQEINQQSWIMALHLGSEVDGFYSKYLATVKGDLALMISLSADQSQFKKYDADFEQMMKGLKINLPSALQNKAPASELVGTATPMTAQPTDLSSTGDQSLLAVLTQTSTTTKVLAAAALLLVISLIHTLIKT